MKALNQYKWYKSLKVVQDEVQTIEHINSTERNVHDQYTFYRDVKLNGFNISKGVGINNGEIQPGNITEFMKLIKLDNDGNIKVKFK